VKQNSELKKLGVKVRSLRMAKGLSQEEFAELCGLHRNYIGGIERGERNVAFLNLLKIATALKISLSELFKGIE
jgi:transcriptional regulator with XRE-family HTH domain